MAEKTGIELALGLFRAQPATAAAVLETLSAGSGAAVLQDVPPRLGAPVVTRMLPTPASRCLLHMPTAAAAAIIREMPPAAAAPLLRAWPLQRLDPLLAALPNRTTIVLRLLLGFPATSVGAWMDPEPPLVPDECDAGAALDQLRKDARDLERFVFVVDREHMLRGRVRTAELLRAEPAERLKSMVESADVTLPARGDLLAYRDDPGWDAGDLLPVVARDGRVIGVLRHSDLVRGLAAAHPTGVLSDPALNLADSYWLGLARLMEELIGMVPAEPPDEPDTPAITEARK